MKPAAEKLREKLATLTFNAPQIPLVNNIDVAIETDAVKIKDALYRQAFGPVRWVECIAAIAAFGRYSNPQARSASTVIECGPGKVLSGMCKRIDAEIVSGAVFDKASLAEAKALVA